MGKEFKTDELLENLPDYINGKIEDVDLKNAINHELTVNQGFKNEFDSLNKELNAESNIFNFKKSFSAIWKFALPVTAVILMFIGYETFINNNEYINNFKSDSQVVLKNDNSGKIENDGNIYKDTDANGNLEPTEPENNDNFISNMTKSFYPRQTDTDKNKITDAEENNNIAIDISENASDEDVFFSNEEEPNIEQEFEKLNSEEQNKILNEIKNSKF